MYFIVTTSVTKSQSWNNVPDRCFSRTPKGGHNFPSWARHAFRASEKIFMRIFSPNNRLVDLACRSVDTHFDSTAIVEPAQFPNNILSCFLKWVLAILSVARLILMGGFLKLIWSEFHSVVSWGFICSKAFAKCFLGTCLSFSRCNFANLDDGCPSVPFPLLQYFIIFTFPCVNVRISPKRCGGFVKSPTLIVPSGGLTKPTFGILFR